MVDENLTWNDHIHILENKLSKNIGLLYRAKPYLDKNTMTTLYFSFFHSYLNYGNIKLRKIASQQRQAVNAKMLKMITKKSLILESSWKKMAF